MLSLACGAELVFHLIDHPSGLWLASVELAKSTELLSSEAPQIAAIYSVPTMKIILIPVHSISAPLSSESQERELDRFVPFGQVVTQQLWQDWEGEAAGDKVPKINKDLLSSYYVPGPDQNKVYVFKNLILCWER